ncbi:Fic family protein [Candidatus Parcubacteria bacterium]|nr:Fic family protein [Candidatus Parcubacteria bacterium]
MTNSKIQHKNFRLKDLKYSVDDKISEEIFDLQKRFNQKFTKDEQKKLAFSQKVDYVYNTVALEGNTYTYAETETLLSGVTVGGHTVNEEDEILNQKDAWEFTLNLVLETKIKLSSKFIKDIHFKVGKDTVVKPGQYRDGRVKIGGTNYVPPKTLAEIDNLIELFVSDYNDLNEQRYIKAIIIHFVIALIQPFFDGNKRTARLLMNYELLKNNYPLFSISIKQRKEYIDAMIKAYETLDINDLIKLLSKLMLNNLKNIC